MRTCRQHWANNWCARILHHRLSRGSHEKNTIIGSIYRHTTVLVAIVALASVLQGAICASSNVCPAPRAKSLTAHRDAFVDLNASLEDTVQNVHLVALIATATVVSGTIYTLPMLTALRELAPIDVLASVLLRKRAVCLADLLEADLATRLAAQ
jgi:hypothetical protein